MADTLVFTIEVDDKGSAKLGSFEKKLLELQKTAERFIPTLAQMNDAILKLQSVEIAANALKQLQIALGTVNASVKEFADKVNIKLNLGDEINITEKTFNSFRDSVRTGSQEAADGFRRMGDEAKQAGATMGDALKADILAPFKNGISAVQEYFPTFSSAGVAALSLLSDAFTSLASFAVSAFETLYAGMVKSGEVVIEFVTDSAKAFIRFEDVMSEVRKTMSLSKEETKAFGDAIRKMALELPGISAEGLAEVAIVAGQLGIAKENVLDFALIMQKFEVATGIAADKAATSFAKILQAYAMPVDQTNTLRMADTVAFLGDKTAATEQQIINFLTRVSGSGASLDIMPEKLAAISATMESIGAGGERGASSFIDVLNKMQTRTQDWADALKIPVGELRTAIETDAVGALQLVLTKFNELSASEGVIATRERLKEIGLTGTYAAENFMKLSNNIPMLMANLAALKDASGSLEQQFQANLERFSLQWADLQETLLEIYRIIGEPLVNALTELLTQDINPLVTQFTEWLKTSKLINEVWPGIIDILKIGIGILIDLFKTFVTESDICKYFQSIGGSWKEIEVKIIQGLVNWATKAKEFIESFDWVGLYVESERVIDSVWNGLVKLVKYLSDVSARQEDVRAAWVKIQEAVEMLQIAWETLRDTAKDLYTLFVEPIIEIYDWLAKGEDIFKVLGDTFLSNLMYPFEKFGLLVEKVFSTMWDWVGKVGESLSGLAAKLADIVVGLVTVDDTGVQNSTWPDMNLWVDKNIKTLGTMREELAATDQQVRSMGNNMNDMRERAEDATSSYKAPIFKGGRYAAGSGGPTDYVYQDYVKAQREQEEAQAAEYQKKKAAQQAAANPITSTSGGISINFNGTNIVDDRTKDNFMREIKTALNSLGAKVVTA